MEGHTNVAAWLDAIHRGSYVAGRQVLRSDQDVNVRGLGGTTALHVAARYNAVKKIEKLLVDGADMSMTDDHGDTPLRIAQRHNKTNAVRYLIYHEELLRALAQELGRTPVLEDVLTMLQHKKQIPLLRRQVERRVDEQGERLVTAARTGDLETVKAMVEEKIVSIDALHPTSDETAFAAALTAGHQRVCDYLLANEARVSGSCTVNSKQQSVLVGSVMEGDVNSTRRIVSLGANLCVPELDTDTSPLAEAVKLGSIEMIDALLLLGARATPNRHGLCPPWPADRAFHYDKGTDIEEQTPFWLLALACWLQDKRVIDHLFTTQVALQNREMMARHGARALFVAVCRKNEQLVEELLGRGVEVDASIPFDMTAIVAAAAVNCPSLLRLLASRGANLTVIHRGLRRFTGKNHGLLVTAAFAGATDCALELLPKERRPLELDNALCFAAGGGNFMLVKTLLDIGLPSKADVLSACLARTHCPFVSDLLLARCASELFSKRDLNTSFSHQCYAKDAGIVAVFLAHGADVDGDASASSDDLPLLRALVRGDAIGDANAQLLLKHGARTDPSILRRPWHVRGYECEKRPRNTYPFARNRIVTFSVPPVDITWCECEANVS